MRRSWQDSPDSDFEPQPQLSLPSMAPVTKALLWINGGIFLAFLLLGLASGEMRDALYQILWLDPGRWVQWFPLAPLWQLVTYGFLHSEHDPFHILFNLLGIYFFGTMLERIIGSRRFLVLYLAAIVLGGVAQLTVELTSSRGIYDAGQGTLIDTYARTVGASGGVLAIVVAAAVLRPNTRVIFVIFPMTLKVLALIFVGLDLYRFLFGGAGGTAVVVHLAGAAWGFCAVRFGWVWFDPFEWRRVRTVRRVREKQQSDQERLDQLLKQIHDHGMNTLSRGDREFLRRVSERPGHRR